MTTDVRTALEAAIRAARADAPVGTRLVALGWSSVESERTERGFGAVFEDGADDALIGARCRIAAGLAEIPIVVVEPMTEGPLAGSLARHGEGPAVAWYVADGRTAPGTGPVAGRPFGREMRLTRNVTDARLSLLVEVQTATIADMTDPTTERAPVTLRAATAGDAETIASLFTDEGYPAGPSDIVARLERFGSAHSRVVVAEHEGAVMGFMAVHAMPRFEHDDRILRILALVVDAGARERGVGRTLMVEAERIGTELGAAFVEITAAHHRPEARHLYESQGYDSTVTTYLRKKL